MYQLDHYFKRYQDFSPKVPVWCLTPNKGCYTHRFFDTCPLSPSGRYLAVLNMPYEDQDAVFGDTADVVLVDLYTGEEKIVYQTKGWQHQLGANINWGADDNQLICNDIDCETLHAFSVNLNPHTGEIKKLEHEIYHVSPDGKYGVSSNLLATIATQYGYGITVPSSHIPTHTIHTQDDGVWIIDTQSGKATLLVSLADLFVQTHSPLEREHLKDGECYVFHTKWSPDGKKLMITTRYKHATYAGQADCNNIPGAILFCVYTCNADGSDLQVAIDETQWVKGGHHTTWSPDSQCLTMNLKIDLDGLRLCRASLAGRHVEKLIDTVRGSGHPSYHKDKNIMITDTYENEPTAYGDGSVPIRIIDFNQKKELDAPIRINVAFPARTGVGQRVDPHVVWDRTGRYCVFNGHTDGCRRVFIADLGEYLADIR